MLVVPCLYVVCGFNCVPSWMLLVISYNLTWFIKKNNDKFSFYQFWLVQKFRDYLWLQCLIPGVNDNCMLETFLPIIDVFWGVGEDFKKIFGKRYILFYKMPWLYIYFIKISQLLFVFEKVDINMKCFYN